MEAHTGPLTLSPLGSKASQGILQGTELCLSSHSGDSFKPLWEHLPTK